jgi:hypothetical protein
MRRVLLTLVILLNLLQYKRNPQHPQKAQTLRSQFILWAAQNFQPLERWDLLQYLDSKLSGSRIGNYRTAI